MINQKEKQFIGELSFSLRVSEPFTKN